MGKTSKLTVCIPCFNEERFIGEAIESVLGQSYGDFVLKVIDDKSTDNTLGVVGKFRDPRIEICKNRKKLGLYKNLNRCLELSDTSYVKILCADDFLALDCLGDQVKILERFSGVSLVFGGSKVVDSEGKVLLRRKLSDKTKRIEGPELARKVLRSARNLIGEPSGLMYRNSLVRENKLFFDASEFKHMADLDFLIRLLEHGDAYYINRNMFSFRLHKSAGTYSLLKRSIVEHRKLLEKYESKYRLAVFEKVLFNFRLYINFLGKMVFVKLFAK